MNCRRFFTLALLVPLWPCHCDLAVAQGAESLPHPNIVLMMADDMGMGDTSAYQDFTGNTDDVQIHTPQMERLARMGMRFTDAHTPSSRCTTTRYGLLTGRYPWRNRMKHWVLFGAQGDPLIEADRPTLATLLRNHGYRTGMVGKWHVGLRYRQSDGRPAAGWEDADLTQPLLDTPLDHGFDFCRYTSRSHGTSGATGGNRRRPNDRRQSVGPGHLDGRRAIGASGDGKRLVENDPRAYVLAKLGSRHSDHAIEFLGSHLADGPQASRPFFLYYPSNSNHAPYTPDNEIGGVGVAGAAESVSGAAMDTRSDFVYENDVALGRLLDYLQTHDDPRRPGHRLIANTIVIFTSDNGAEIDQTVATGPFRSHKGSSYEGGHRVPLIVSWPAGGVGDGDADHPGASSDQLVGLQDLFATFADVLGTDLPDLRDGQKGAEDSISVLAAWRGKPMAHRPMFYHDHKQATDPAAAAMRLDDPIVDGKVWPGQWKLFCDASLLRQGRAIAIELYDLASDPQELHNRIKDSALKPLIGELTRQASLHRNCGGHRIVAVASSQRLTYDWQTDDSTPVDGDRRLGLAKTFAAAIEAAVTVTTDHNHAPIEMRVTAANGQREVSDIPFTVNRRGLGVGSGSFGQVDDGEAILIRFNRDVIVESASIVAGNGVCGGFYRVADKSPLAIYCVDGDIDSNDQSGILSDIGVLRAGETLRLDSSPHYGVESAGHWRLSHLTIRLLRSE